MVLRWESVAKRFGREVALAGVDLSVRRGERYGLVGHNGAGKSTLLRIALGLVRPDAGRVLVGGLDAARAPREARALLGAAIETPGFHGGLDARTNLAWLARLQGFDPAAARAEAERVLELVDLAAQGKKRVRAFSQGMRQRLALAQALLGAPPILLLDEPTNGLDPEGIARVLALLRRLSEEGTSVLVSSHRLSELDGWCTRLGVLRQGRVLLEEEPRVLAARAARVHELVATPLPRVRELLADLGVGVEPGEDPGQLLVLDGAHAPAELVERLVRGGCAVASFAPRRARLEEVLLAAATQGAPGAAPPAGPRRSPRPSGGAGERDGADAVPERAAGVAGELRAGSPAPGSRASLGPVARVLGYELRRLGASRGAQLAFLLPILLGIAAVLRRAVEGRLAREAVEAGELYSATAANGYEGLALALQAGLPPLVWVAVGWAGLSLAGELSRGTLASVLVRPLTRLHVGLGKLAAALLVPLAALVLLLAAGTAASALCFDFGDVVETLPNGKPFVLLSEAELLAPLPAVLAPPAAALLAMVAVGWLVGALARSGTLALGASLGAVLLLELARAPARLLGREALLPTAHLPSPLGGGSSLDAWLASARGFSDASLPPAGPALAVAAAWGAGALLVALLVLSRRDYA